jgi:hypothetical protein
VNLIEVGYVTENESVIDLSTTGDPVEQPSHVRGES